MLLQGDSARLLEALKSENPWVREYGAFEAGRLRLEDAIPSLVDLLKDDQERVAIMAGWALGQVGSRAQTAIPELISILKRPNRTDPNLLFLQGTVASAADALQRMEAMAVPALLEVLRDPAEHVRLRALTTLGRIGLVSGEVVHALIHALEDESTWVRSEAGRLLAGMGTAAHAAVPALRGLLSDANLFVRCWADFALRVTQPSHSQKFPHAVSCLITCLSDKDRAIRARAAQTLGYLGLEAVSAVPALLSALKDPENLPPREAIQALARIASQDKSVRSELIAALAEQDSDSSGHIALVLARMGLRAKAALPYLIRLLKDDSSYVRQCAIEAIGVIGQEGDGAVPHILGLLLRTKTQVRCRDCLDQERLNAAITIGRIGVLRKTSVLPGLIQTLHDPNLLVRSAAACSIRRLDPGIDTGCLLEQVELDGMCPIIHRKQRLEKDCGVAVVAMITGATYESVLAIVPAVGKCAEMACREIAKLLKRLSGREWRWQAPWCFSYPLVKVRLRRYPAVVLIRGPGSLSSCHYIAMYRDIVHDPEFDCAFALGDYPNRNWLVRGVLDSSEELIA